MWGGGGEGLTLSSKHNVNAANFSSFVALTTVDHSSGYKSNNSFNPKHDFDNKNTDLN